MKKLRMFLSVVLTLCFILTAGCGNVLVPVQTISPATSTPIQVPTETSIPSQNSTPTLIPTETSVPSPTDTLTPTPTATPAITPTPTKPPVEWDLDPYIEKVIDHEWEGIRIKARILVDRSLESVIKSLDVQDDVFAEVVARSIFVVWYARNNPDVGWLRKDKKYFSPVWVHPEEFHPFMEMWAKAQETNNPEDWKKVQINNVWANNLNDGNGYQQRPYAMWPMFYGEAPSGIVGMDMLTLALVKTSSVSNLFKSQHYDNYEFRKLLDAGLGTNINGGDLIVYRGISWDPNLCEGWPSVKVCFRDYLYESIGLIPTWLSMNSGEPWWFTTVMYDWIYYYLMRGGIDAQFIIE